MVLGTRAGRAARSRGALGFNFFNFRAGGRRRRWQTAHPKAFWHADVCHGPSLRIEGRTVPHRIHAILDDASRYIVAIRALSTEREADILALMTDTVRRLGMPERLHFDNGST